MHRIEILRARYVLQLLVGYIVKKFQPKIPTYMSRRIFLSLLKKANFGQHKTSPNMIKNWNPQNFRRHSYPKVVSNQLYFSKFQNLFFSYLVPKFFKILKIYNFGKWGPEKILWLSTILWHVVLAFFIKAKASEFAIEATSFFRKPPPKITFLKREKNSPGQIRWNWGLKTCPSRQNQKLKKTTCPQNFDPMHGFWENR